MVRKVTWTCFPKRNLSLGDSPTVVSCSIFVLFIQWPGHHSRGSSPVEPPDLQSPAAPAGLPHHRRHHGTPGKKLAQPSSCFCTLWMTQGKVEGLNAWSRTQALSSLYGHLKSMLGAEVHTPWDTSESLEREIGGK
jgi:hypothetical protein